jgi:DNA-binding CsgD family transcriptional regulator
MGADDVRAGRALRVGVLESSPIYLRGLAAVLTGAGMEVVDLHGAADVFLVDPEAVRDVPLADLVGGLRQVAPVLLLHDGQRYGGCGADGVIASDASPDAVVAAVRQANGPVAGPEPARDGGKPAPQPAPLSAREQQVLRGIAAGLTHRQVARSLGISENTVDTYVRRVRAKLGVGNKAALTRVAVFGALVPEPQPSPTAGSAECNAAAGTVVACWAPVARISAG